MVEFIAMVLSMLGAYLMSRDLNLDSRAIYKANWSFMFANILLMQVASVSGMVPLLIQMILFFIISAKNIILLSKDISRDIIILLLLSFISYLIVTYYSTNSHYSFNISVIEIIAASIAISGSILMSTKNDNIRLFMFIMFFIADIIYVLIAIDHGLFFFMIQSAFYLWTSIEGFNYTLKNKILF